MREIKFRAWDKSKKRMISWKNIDQEMSFHALLFRTLDDIIPLQYTGLKDKNDIEIYEGDIILWDAKNGGDIGYVEWSEDELAWIASEKEGDGAWLCGADIYGTVLGNIYENPEVLEKKKKS